jgi:hypothetical protein
MPVERAEIDGPACPASGAENIEPRHSGEQRRAVRWRRRDLRSGGVARRVKGLGARSLPSGMPERAEPRTGGPDAITQEVRHRSH